MKKLLVTALAVAALSALVVCAYAAATPEATLPGWLDTVAALYGPTCGVLVAVVILCERIARLIPNSTTSKILKVLLLVTTVLGLKVPDNQ
jgi:hypothetical protein